MPFGVGCSPSTVLCSPILALSSISSSPFSQSLVILSAIFAFFAVVYTILLVFCIEDRESKFSAWFLRHWEVLLCAETQSSWTPSTMLYVPLAWMAWAALCLLCSLIALGLQSFQSDLESMHNTTSADPTVNDTSISAHDSASLNIVQCVAFMLAITWSSVYVVKIYIEISKCR
ncbi:hypothetical protein C8R45DRAFT_1115 [Mycena sanguinolenta]|nr:hypothetical protein C8R45DRAFT_1115 [Mycena sanguinolenta]